ncbi:hypothetical protein DD985_06975 [Pseudomonas sp. HMWF011]|nr:hypothetical protein C2U56_13865 [Pseudomonas fluorescens]PTT13034.1 hypothetical protein DBR14_08720 [Pseudomonas sp. HMWF034]PVV75408.1 hypothetical protein DD985_06975 [Pseudomonas sp. HMWF011]RZI26023.1 hypothetical protein EUX58_07745 [Pseudomonas sp. 770NI]TKK40306.1 hypothetical protein PflCFBP13517_17560 [Pseudomonas fluorescens]
MCTLRCNPPVGAGLPAIAAVNPTSLSQASQLPHWFCSDPENFAVRCDRHACRGVITGSI